MITIRALYAGQSIRFPLNLAGLPVLLGGVYMAIHTKRLFIRTGTPMSPGAVPRQLHVDGVFRFTRNPMYLGITTGLLGVVILTGVWLNIAFPLLYALLMNMFFIPDEEQNLEQEFGQTFLEYRLKTRRWI